MVMVPVVMAVVVSVEVAVPSSEAAAVEVAATPSAAVEVPMEVTVPPSKSMAVEVAVVMAMVVTVAAAPAAGDQQGVVGRSIRDVDHQ